MSLLVASLYLLCLAFLFGSAIFVYSKDPFSRLNSSYALLALSLLCWVGSLFFFSAETQNPSLLWLGRFNFAAAAVVAPSVYFFVCALASKPILRAGLIWVEAGLLVIVSLFTGLVDKSEAVVTGEHITAYGALFPLYMLHILAFVILALLVAFN